jgi:hypothetical protein
MKKNESFYSGLYRLHDLLCAWIYCRKKGEVMTKWEAIKWINDRMCWGRGKFTKNHPPTIDEYWEAGLMAIEALKKETGCDGCRQLQIYCFKCARRKKDYYKGASE